METSGLRASDLLIVLLEDEYFLLKVLAHLVEDGLHECRLVCRRWRDACGKLPVKLDSMCLDKLQRLADMFPKAETLSISKIVHDADVIEREVVPQLPRLKNLNSLCVFFFGESLDLRNLVACFSSMQHLKSLQLWNTNEDTLHCLIHGLHYLKHLTSLVLNHICVLQNNVDPNSRVQGLRELSMPFELLINRRGELVFPMLTGLTSLNIDRFSHIEPQQPPRNLQVCQFMRSLVCQLVCVVTEYPALRSEAAIGYYSRKVRRVVFGGTVAMAIVLASVKPGHWKVRPARYGLFSSTAADGPVDASVLILRIQKRRSSFCRKRALAHKSQIP